jgi:hypothetical protein
MKSLGSCPKFDDSKSNVRLILDMTRPPTEAA